MPAIAAAHPGETIMQVAAVQIAVNHMFDVGTKEAVPALEPILIDLFECFKMIFNTMIIWGVLGIALAIYGCCHGNRYLFVLGNETYPAANSVPTLHFGFLRRPDYYMLIIHDKTRQKTTKICNGRVFHLPLWLNTLLVISSYRRNMSISALIFDFRVASNTKIIPRKSKKHPSA